MSIRRWVPLTVFFVALFVTRHAGAVNTITFTTSPVDTGNTFLGATSSIVTGTLSSSGNGDVVDLVVTGTCSVTTGTGTFTAVESTGNTATSINLNSSKTINITYSPTNSAAGRGARQCTVNVVDSATPTNVRTSFEVKGKGVTPIVTAANVSIATPVRLVSSPAAVHSAQVNLVISNAATADASLSVGTVTSNNTDWVVTPPGTNNPLAAGASNTWVLTFSPTTTGADNATITINSNDPLTPAKTITASGSGGSATITTSDVPFGIVDPATPSSQTISITNTASPAGPMSVTKADFTNNTAPDGSHWFKFTQAGCVGSTTTCALALSITSTAGTVGVQCAPPAGSSGMQTAQVVFTSDADNAADNTAVLTCTAGRADIVVTTTPLMFSTTQLINTTSAVQYVMIQNMGNVPLKYSVALTGTNPGQFATTGAICTTTCTLAATSSYMYPVYFSPTATGAKTANLSVTASNDPDNPPTVDVGLSGTCVAPSATFNPANGGTLPFGNIEVNATATGQTITVTNNGTSDLTISTAYLSANPNNTYMVTSGTTGNPLGTAIVVPKTMSASWTVTCHPTVQGLQSGTFHIVTDSNSAPATADISLTCTGTKGNLSVATSPFDFGQKLEGSMTSQTFTLSNTGNLPVSNVTVTPSGTGTGYTILSPTFPITSLAAAGQAGSSVTVTVQFYPMNGNDGGTYNYTFAGTWGTNNTATNTVLNLNGDGLSTGFDTTPSNPYPLDWGDIRFDTPTVANLAVTNTSGTSYNVLTVTVAPDANTASSELVISSCVKGGSSSVTLAVPANTPTGCPTAAAPYTSPTLNDTMTVKIQCKPNNRVGMVGGTITIHSNLPDPTKQDKTVMLKCNSTTAVLSLSPSNTVDFGPIDLDVAPTATTKTVTLKNMGTAAMNIGTAVKAGANAGAFALTSTPVAQVGPNGTYSFDVTYTPTGEKPANQPDVASLTLPLAGAIGTPGSLVISFSGYGVDRHIGIAPAPIFPNTFKNPGDKAPILPVTITNNGDANLNVSAVMLSDYPIWTIVNPDPVDVSGRMSYDFQVKFEPITAGKAPTGHMVIMDNDNQKPVVSVDLDGNGLDRQVAFGPPEINMGYVGIGIATRLSETGADPTKLLLDVQNNEDNDTFMITRIGVDGGDGAFEVVNKDNNDPPSNTELAPRSTQEFDVVFTPTHEGDFVADANLYLDNAASPHATVRLRGRGLYVDVKGGGGCSTGRNTGGGTMLLVLGALLVGRRRRRRAALVGALSVVGVSAVAQADTRNLDTALFDPTPATHVNTLQSQSADVGDDGEYAVEALVTYADNPLVLKTTQNTYTPVDNRAMLVLGGAYAFGKRFEAGLRMPLYLQSGQATEMQTEQFQVNQIDSVSRGDATVHVKMNGGAAEALGGDLSYGGAFALTIPTRSSSEFSGTNMPQARLLGLATLTEGRLVLQVNAGGIVRSKERYSSLVQRSGGTFAVGGNYRMADKLWLGAEVFGNVIPGGKTGTPAPMEAYGAPMTETSIEGLAEMTYRMSRTSTLGLALGRGINSGVGTSNVRGALVFAYTPGATALVPLPKHIHVEGPNDKDGDGIKDKLDACPNEPEDKDMFEDGDGCPDVDNDNDGIDDDKDKCPTDPEDKDRFQDDDGCPEKDNDGDGIMDDQDKCPLAAEDKDGFQDADGCPEADNDGDGIVDKADKCPNEPESINGNNDDDGCPDKGDALVVMSPDRLDLLDNITFEGNGSKIARASKNILGQIGATLRAHPELVRIRLTAHVQPTSNAAKDQALSEARAKAVQNWLVDWGIDPLRLQSSGFGGTKPLVDPKGRGAQAINDRFELIILERK